MRLNRSSALLLLLIVVLSGCVSNRLKGPIYSAQGPAWIAEGLGGEVAPLELRHRVLLIGDTGLFLEDDPSADDAPLRCLRGRVRADARRMAHQTPVHQPRQAVALKC